MVELNPAQVIAQDAAYNHPGTPVERAAAIADFNAALNEPCRGPVGTAAWWLWSRPDGGNEGSARAEHADLAATLARLPATDADFARAMWELYGSEAHYVPGRAGGWYLWQGTHHAQDDCLLADRRIGTIQAFQLNEAVAACRQRVHQNAERGLAPEATAADRKAAKDAAWAPWKKAEGFAAKLKANDGLSAALGYTARTLGVSASAFEDRFPDCLNTPDGLYELRTGMIAERGIDPATGLARRHDPADMITYCTPVSPGWGSRCPLFWSTLCRMCARPDDSAPGGYVLDLELAGYVLRTLGYAILGHNPDHRIFFWNGPTKSGKTVVLTVVCAVLGPLAKPGTGNALICYEPHGRNARVENSVAGKRVVVVAESSEHRKIDEAQVKRLTGEPEIDRDQHYAVKEIATMVTWTIISPTNEMSSLGRPDDALRRRYAVIPTGPTVPEDEQAAELAKQIIETEGPAVLALLMRAASRYYAEGLHDPLSVRMATDAYFGESNQVAAYVRDCLVPREGAALERTAVYANYEQWAGKDKEFKRNTFYKKLGEQPGVTMSGYEDSGHGKVLGMTWSESQVGNPDWVK